MWHAIRRTMAKCGEMRRYHGTRYAIGWTAECALQRLGYERNITTLCDLAIARTFPPIPPGFEGRLLSIDDLRAYSREPQYDLGPDMVERAERGLDLCTALVKGDELVSYGWYALASIEPEHNAGIPMSYPSNYSYAYKKFTLPAYRGQGLAGVRAGHAHELLKEMGIRYLIGFVRSTNPAALRDALRTGYTTCGGTMRFGPSGVYCTRALRRLGLQFGAKADLSSRMKHVDRGAEAMDASASLSGRS